MPLFAAAIILPPPLVAVVAFLLCLTALVGMLASSGVLTLLPTAVDLFLAALSCPLTTFSYGARWCAGLMFCPILCNYTQLLSFSLRLLWLLSSSTLLSQSSVVHWAQVPSLCHCTQLLSSSPCLSRLLSPTCRLSWPSWGHCLQGLSSCCYQRQPSSSCLLSQLLPARGFGHCL